MSLNVSFHHQCDHSFKKKKATALLWKAITSIENYIKKDSVFLFYPYWFTTIKKKSLFKSLFQPFHLHEGSSIPTEQFNLSNRMYRSWIDIPGNAISVSNAFPPKRKVAMIYATRWSRNAKEVLFSRFPIDSDL